MNLSLVVSGKAITEDVMVHRIEAHEDERNKKTKSQKLRKTDLLQLLRHYHLTLLSMGFQRKRLKQAFAVCAINSRPVLFIFTGGFKVVTMLSVWTLSTSNILYPSESCEEG
ncbi:hypothetical protein DPMN_128481 [Dreissena polymorpha]|uniref:Uncharacterized protein n=1 Tax=Dreissena polymorpha TaxID=45954 RepID=A0A9D4H370_DREPO|nr:hypothetical protein DPMN_128481 [Dreissena polymorpha]